MWRSPQLSLLLLLLLLIAVLDNAQCSFNNVVNDALGDASLPPEHNASALPFTCARWPELLLGDFLGHGRAREAYAAAFRRDSVVVKVPLRTWKAAPAEQIDVFRSEVGRLERLRAQGNAVPRLLGYCLDAAVGIAVVCERLVPLPEALRAPLRWLARLELALSAARMVQQWRHYVDYRGEASPRWFWDLSAANVGVDVALRRVAILDVESFAPYVVLAEHHDVSNRCKRNAQCVPRRLVKFHTARLQNLTELACDLDSRRCLGVLDDRTNVFRICVVVVQPLLALRLAPAAQRSDVRALLRRCLDNDQNARLSSLELAAQLEALRDAAAPRGRRPGVSAFASQFR